MKQTIISQEDLSYYSHSLPAPENIQKVKLIKWAKNFNITFDEYRSTEIRTKPLNEVQEAYNLLLQLVEEIKNMYDLVYLPHRAEVLLIEKDSPTKGEDV